MPAAPPSSSRVTSFFDGVDPAYDSSVAAEHDLGFKAHTNLRPERKEVKKPADWIMSKAIKDLQIGVARKRLRYQNYELHKMEAANHAIYLIRGGAWAGHAQAKKLAEITKASNDAMAEAGDAAYTSGKASNQSFRQRRVAIITARKEARVSTRGDLAALTDAVNELFTPTKDHKPFANPVPKETGGTYNAMELRKWCARTTRIVMLVAEMYVKANPGGEFEDKFADTALVTERLHVEIHKLRNHIKKLKAPAKQQPQPQPVPVYLPPMPIPGYAPMPVPGYGYPGYQQPTHHHHKPNHAAWTTPVEPTVVVHHGARPRRAPKAPAPSHIPQSDAGGG
jgi:hypothetical protein